MKRKIDIKLLKNNLFANKKIIIYCTIGFLSIILICLSEVNFDKKENKKIDANTKNNYCDLMEEKIENIVSSINGAGNTKVMITIAETEEFVYAKNSKDNHKITEKNNDIHTQNDYVLIDDKGDDSGLLLKTLEPKIQGVVIVCDGGDNATVQNEIYSAISALLNISTNKIHVSKLSNSEVHK